MAQTSSQRKNILAMGGFLAFIALMTLLLFVANYISQRTQQVDTEAAATTYDKHYLRVFLHESGKRFYTQFCDAASVSPTGTPINFNACGAMRTHTVNDLKLPDVFLNQETKEYSIGSISISSKTVGNDEYVRLTVTRIDNFSSHYEITCKITGGSINDCFNQTTQWLEVGSLAKEMDGELFDKVRSYEESEYVLSTGETSMFVKTALSPVLDSDNQYLYDAICTHSQTNPNGSCPGSSITSLKDVNTFGFPEDIEIDFKGVSYSFENHSGVNKLREAFILKEGNGYISRLCNIANSETIDIHSSCGTWTKVIFAQNVQGLPEKTIRDWTSMIGELESVPWTNIAKSYIQTFLSTDKTKLYQRYCPINEDKVPAEFFGDSVIYPSCTAWTTHEITALNSNGLSIDPQKLKSIDFFDYKKANGAEFMRQQLVINDPVADIDKLYTRDCPILYKTLECANVAWTSTNVSALQIVDANQTLGRIRGLDTTITKHTNDLRLRQVALQEDGKAIFSRACEYNPDTLALSNCSVWDRVVINTLDFDNDPDNGLGAIEDVLLATDTYTQMVNGVLNIRQSFLREDGQSIFTRICRLNDAPNGSFDCQATTPNGRFWSEIDLNEWGDGVDLIVNTASGLDGSVSPAKSLALPTVTGTVTPTPTVAPPVVKNYIRSFLSEDKGTIYEQTCEVNETLTGDTVKYDACTQFKSYPVSVLNGKKAGGDAVTFTSANVDSVNFYNYKDSNGKEKIKINVLVDNSNLFSRSCGIKANKVMNCTDNNLWSKQTIDKLGIMDGTTEIKKLNGYDASITTHKVSPNVQVLKEYIREVALSQDMKVMYTRTCPVSTSGVADMTIPSDCTSWVKETFNTDFDFNNNGLPEDEDIILGVDSYVQKFNNELSMRVSFIRESGETFFTRICPLSEYAYTGIGAYNCFTTPKRTFSEVDIDGSVGLPVAKASGVNGLLSTAKSFGFRQVDTSVTPSPTPLLSAVSCSEKSVSFAEGAAYLDSKVTYTIELAYPTPGVEGTVVLRDDYSDGMEIDLASLPDGCSVPEVLGASTVNTGDGKVLGVSDYYTERGSLLISVILLSIVAGGTAYVIVINNKESIKSELFRKSPYLAGLLATGAVLIIGGALIVLTRNDIAPSDTPALTGKYIECTVPAGTTTISYDMTIKGEVGEEVSNVAEVSTNGVYSLETCENTFTIEEGEVTNTLTPTPVENTVTPTPTPVEGTVTPTPTPLVGTVTPSPTPLDVTPTPTVIGVACGPADIITGQGQNDKFDIVDFGGTGGFASFYGKTCNDSASDFSNPETGVDCKGKDVTLDNVVNIFDFISFAERYAKASCAF